MMWKKIGVCNFLLIPAVLIIQLVLLAGVGVVLRAGTGSLNNHDHLPVTPNLWMILIDTDQYSKDVGEETYKGLPDSHDFSKQKDFFAIFPALYCSGSKDGDKYEADYCSPWGRQLFDLQRLWRVWGVDLIHDQLIGSNPKIICSTLLATAASTGLSLVTGLISLCSYWSAVLSTILSWISTISMIATAALSYTFVSKLASHIKNLKLDGSGKLVVHWGNGYLHLTWVGAGLALLSSLLLTFSWWRRRKTRSKQKQSTSQAQFPLLGVVRRATGAFGGQAASYKHLDEDNEFEKHASRHGSVSVSRSPSTELLERGSFSRGRDFEKPTAYEPMRHRSVG